MPSGLPDFWQGTIAGMPAIGAGQVAWFQSELKEVALEGSEDLVNYVVPDDMELHVCSGVVSCDFPRTQRYDLRQTPAATWISPTSHIDPDNKWTGEDRAYNGDIGSCADTFIGTGAWSSYLILLVNEQNIDKVRFYAKYYFKDINKIWVDVWYGGGWVHVYDGAFTDKEWVEKPIILGTQLVSKARVRFWNDWPADAFAYLYEFMFNTAETTPQKGIWFDTHAIIPYLPQAPYIVPAEATFAVRVYNDDDAAHNMSVALAGFLQKKV